MVDQNWLWIAKTETHDLWGWSTRLSEALSPVGCGWTYSMDWTWSGMSDQTGIWGIRGLVDPLRSFLWCGLVHCPGATAVYLWWLLLPWKGLLSETMFQWVLWVKAHPCGCQTQGFQAEHWTVVRWSMLYTLAVSTLVLTLWLISVLLLQPDKDWVCVVLYSTSQ